jgi:hypothetical protein
MKLTMISFIAILFVIVAGATAAFAQHPCPYVPGDINSNGQVNGIDILYFINWVRGGPPPPDSCDCPPMPFPFYAAADVNGNCAVNGIDVTYLVSYLKGGAPIRFCNLCPPEALTENHNSAPAH